MDTNHNIQAILLLTAYFGKSTRDDIKPLSVSEWGRFARWMIKNKTHPEDFLFQDPFKILSDWQDETITTDRVQKLLERRVSLGLAMEKWERAGLWILSRSDPDYPKRIRKRLGDNSPAILFGCGNKSLLNSGGIAVVGSRDASEDDIEFAKSIGNEAAKQEYSIVSGGAKGIDEAAMLGALESHGTIIGVLADSLLRTASSTKYRQALLQDSAVLISPYNPETGFDVRKSMGRNKYIYCLSDAAIIVNSDHGNGGTWSGAVENLRSNRVPLYVRKHEDSNSGNMALVEKGANLIQEGASFSEIIHQATLIPNETTTFHLEDRIYSETTKLSLRKETNTDNIEGRTAHIHHPPEDSLAFYTLFLKKFEESYSKGVVTPKQLIDDLDLQKSQVETWLDRANKEGFIEKSYRPVRYKWIEEKSEQLTLDSAAA